jgi:hypothetical protein
MELTKMAIETLPTEGCICIKAKPDVGCVGVITLANCPGPCAACGEHCGTRAGDQCTKAARRATYGQCPVCGVESASGTTRERRPNGRTVCGDCKHSTPSSTWKTADERSIPASPRRRVRVSTSAQGATMAKGQDLRVELVGKDGSKQQIPCTAITLRCDGRKSVIEAWLRVPVGELELDTIDAILTGLSG